VNEILEIVLEINVSFVGHAMRSRFHFHYITTLPCALFSTMERKKERPGVALTQILAFVSKGTISNSWRF
jgi:hypothetical protein